MGLIFAEGTSFAEGVAKGLSADFARQATRKSQDNFNNRRQQMTDAMPDWEGYRAQAAAIRDDVLQHLDYYLQEFVTHATENGSQVHFAETAHDAGRILLEICHENQVRSVVKTKSMVSEEIDCNKVLLGAGIEVNETDLGEYMIQLDNWSHPSHLIAPSMHMDQDSVYEMFVAHGYEGENKADKMTLFARDRLREKFLTADLGITGCNFAIASTGATSIITNEGNGRMVTTLPKTQVVLMGMERLLPNLSAFDAMMQVFIRSAIGTKVSSYISMTNGPRKQGEQDGASQVHIIIIDNGRLDMLGGRYQSMLRCIRCGTCQNVCPVFRQITGHGYSACYMGPMGIVYTPLLHGFDHFTKDMPYACTLCGACSEHCPVKIPLHELILAERFELMETNHMGTKEEGRAMTAAGMVLGHGKLFQAGTLLGNPATKALARWTREADHLGERTKVPVLKHWTGSRYLPLMRAGEFRRWFKAHKEER